MYCFAIHFQCSGFSCFSCLLSCRSSSSSFSGLLPASLTIPVCITSFYSRWTESLSLTELFVTACPAVSGVFTRSLLLLPQERQVPLVTKEEARDDNKRSSAVV